MLAEKIVFPVNQLAVQLPATVGDLADELDVKEPVQQDPLKQDRHRHPDHHGDLVHVAGDAVPPCGPRRTEPLSEPARRNMNCAST